MELTLDTEDTLLLQRVIERSLGELRQEIADTESLEWRQSMHKDEDRLKSILVSLAKLLSS